MNKVSIDGCSNVGCTDFDEDYKDSLFIKTTVDEFIFSGYNHGVLRWIIDYKWSGFASSMPTQITKGPLL
jgi:hypothetical protein